VFGLFFFLETRDQKNKEINPVLKFFFKVEKSYNKLVLKTFSEVNTRWVF